MKSILIACIFANGLSTFEMVTYNEIHSEFAEDCALELDHTDSLRGEACQRYFAFLESVKDLRSLNREWLRQADLSDAERAEILRFIQRGNRAMAHILRHSETKDQG